VSEIPIERQDCKLTSEVSLHLEDVYKVDYDQIVQSGGVGNVVGQGSQRALHESHQV